MHSPAQSQITERTPITTLIGMIGNYATGAPKKESDCKDAANEIGRRIQNKVLGGDDLKKITKQMTSIPDNTTNPGRDKILAELATLLKLPELLKNVEDYSNGNSGKKVLCIAAANELIRRSQLETVPSEITSAIEQISAIPSEVQNPGRDLIASHKLSLHDLPTLVGIIVSESGDSKPAAEELVKRAAAADELSRALQRALMDVAEVGRQQPNLGTQVVTEYLRSLPTK